MSLDRIRDALPSYAKDLSLNLSSQANETALTEQQKWGTFLASAHAVGQSQVVQAVEAVGRRREPQREDHEGDPDQDRQERHATTVS